MVGIWAEGFEANSNTNQFQRKYASFAGAWGTAVGRVFGNAGTPGFPQAMTTPSLGLGTTWILGWAMRINSQQIPLNSGARGIYFERGVFEQVHIEFVNNASDFEVRLLRGGTTIATTTSNFAYNIWHHFEISVTMHTSTGAYELRHNEVNVLSGSGVNTSDAGTTDGADVFAIRIGATLSQVSFDDINLKDSSGSSNNGFLGDSVVEAIEVTANGTTNDWINDDTAVSDGNNFGQVDDPGSSAPDETGAGGTVSSDTVSERELYVLSDLVQITGTVAFVHAGIQASVDNSGTRELRFVMRDNGGSTANGDTFTVTSATFEGFNHIFNQNEALSSAWNIAGIDGLQLGFEVVS